MMARVLAAAAALFATPVLAASPGAGDVRAIETLALNADVAWTQKDARAMAALYHPNGTLRIGDGPQRRGRQVIEDDLVRLFATRVGSWRHVTHVRAIDLLADDMALTDAIIDVEQRQPDGSWTVSRRVAAITLSERRGGSWRLRAVRSFSLPQR